MAKNIETRNSNVTGILDADTLKVTYIDKESEVTYDLKKILDKYNGCDVSITVDQKIDVEPSDE